MQMNTGTTCIELRNFSPFAPSEAGNDSRRVSVSNTNTEGNIQFSTILFKSCSKWVKKINNCIINKYTYCTPCKHKKKKIVIVVPPNTKGHFHVALFSSGRSESNKMVKK